MRSAGGDELGTCGVRRRVDELDDRLLGRAVVPGGQGVVVRRDGRGEAQADRGPKDERGELAPVRLRDHIPLDLQAAPIGRRETGLLSELQSSIFCADVGLERRHQKTTFQSRFMLTTAMP